LRTNCGACNYDDLRLILDLGLSPIADAYTKDADEVLPHYPLQLAVCAGCHLVQLLEVVPDLFGTGYSFYSSASAPLSLYHARYANDVINENRDITKTESHKPLVVEIGCNDGDMARHFVTENRFRVIGVDPAVGPMDVAESRGVVTYVKPFGRNLAHEIHAQCGQADIIIANHVLAHVESVFDVFAGISELLSFRGTAYVEVQYLPDLILNNAFDLVYHEHRNFFTLTSLQNAARQHGLYVNEATLTDRQGGSLRVKLRRHSGSSRAVTSLLTSEAWLSDTAAYAGLQGRADRLKRRLRQLLLTERDRKHVVVGYGAPAKATTLLNFCDIDTDLVRYVTDTTEAKRDRYVPGTGLFIYGPDQLEDEHVDTYLLLAWNYAGPIMRKEQAFTIDGGHWILPVPAPILL
jgi:C-methyltransferase C-terminal domain/Methyltransferase domain/Putative zinc binding domain